MTVTLANETVQERMRGENPLKLKRVHHVEFWSGNAKQSAYYYRKAFGFSQIDASLMSSLTHATVLPARRCATAIPQRSLRE